MFLWWLVLNAILQLPNLKPILRLRKLASSGELTTGRVQGTTYHREFTYTFSVDGQDYLGAAVAGTAGIPRYDSLNAGDQIPVCYLRNDPRIHAAGDVQKLLQNEYEFRFLLAGIAAVGVIFLFLKVAIFPNTSVFGLPSQKVNRWLF